MKNAENRVAETDEAYNIVMNAIITQRLAPSQKVSESVLNEMFGISRTASRNLMERLTAQQFLVVVSPRITRVAPLTLLEIKQNFALRRLIAPEMAALTAFKLDFDTMASLKEEIETIFPIENDEEALRALQINRQMNLVLCEKAEYPLMLHWHRQLENTAMRIYWFYVKTNKSLPFTFDQQNVIHDLAKTGDRDKIRIAVYDSLAETEDKVLNGIFSNEQFLAQDLKI